MYLGRKEKEVEIHHLFGAEGAEKMMNFSFSPLQAEVHLHRHRPNIEKAKVQTGGDETPYKEALRRGERGKDAPLLTLIPLKPLAHAKGRLAAVLAADERRALVEHIFSHVVETVRAADMPTHLGVVAGDAQAAALARARGLAVLAEADPWRVEVADVGSGDIVADEGYSVESRLNRALADALTWAEEQGYAAVLILPADLPLLTPEDVRALWERSHALPAPHVVLAPDTRDEGTNALLLRPPTCLAPAFGQGSFRRHLHLARAAGLPVTIVRSPGLAQDLDTPADLEKIGQ